MKNRMKNEEPGRSCRLILDPPLSGSWNMAADEYLLGWSAETKRCCWRFYRWSEPTLSLGYFQRYEDRFRHQASRHCAVVRRASGGGAILHDGELTYSFVAPAEHRLAAERAALYENVHRTLIEVLDDLGVKTCLHGETTPGDLANVADELSPPRSDPQPFLCFQRRSPGDMVVGSTKIVGSAQRRLRGAVLQHGSLLLSRSAAAPELEALDSLVQTPIDEQELVQRWLAKLAPRLGLRWSDEQLTPWEREQVEELVASKYGSADWTQRRGRRSGR